MRRWLTPLLVLLGLFAGLGLLFGRSAARGSYADALSSYRAAEDGSRALYLMLEAAGVRVNRRHLDLEQIDAEGTLVMLGVSSKRCAAVGEDGHSPEATPKAPDPKPPASVDPADPADPNAASPKDEKKAQREATPKIGANPGIGLFSGVLGPKECRSLLDWVAGGKNLIFANDQSTALGTELGLHWHHIKSPEELASKKAREEAKAAQAAKDAEPVSLPSPVDSGESEDQPPWEEWFSPEKKQQRKRKEEEKKTAEKAAAAKKAANSGVHLLPQEKKEVGPIRNYQPGQPSVITRSVRQVKTSAHAWLSTTRSDVVTLLVEKNNPSHALVLALPQGKGWVVVLATSELFTNRSLPKADNAAFALALFQDLAPVGNTVFFDEYHHGHAGSRTVISYAVDHGLLPALFQLLLMVGIAILASRRLGRREPLETRVLRSSADHLATMASLYHLGGHHLHAGLQIARHALDAAANMRARPDVDAAARALEQKLQALQQNAKPERLRAVAEAATALHTLLHTAQKGSRKDNHRAA